MSEHNEHVYFVNQLYRDFLLPTILGSDAPAILYWAGKRITRKYDLTELDDLIEFFDMAELGDLKLVKERRATMVFQLSGQSVADRIDAGNREFSIESGMIAEAVERAKNRSTEAEIEINDKKKYVEITTLY